MKNFLATMLSVMAFANPNGGGCGVGADNANGAGGAPVDPGPLPQQQCGTLGTHYFCDDFESAPFPSRFDSNQDLSAGTLALDTSRSVSPSHSLLATTTVLNGATQTRAWLPKSFPAASGHRFVLGFSEWVAAACLGPNDLVQSGSIELAFAGGSARYHLGVAHAPDSDSILEVSGVNGVYIQAHKLSSPMRHGAWVRVLLDMDLDARTFDFSVDGTRVIQGEPLANPVSAPQLPGIKVGAEVDNITFHDDACTIHIDDVTFDVEP